MYNHAPENYVCPICLAIQGVESEHTMAKQADIVYRDKLTLAYVNSKFLGNNPGHVIVVPTAHFENFYDLPVEYAHAVIETAQKMALALKVVRQCDGVWIEQNNEPASKQHAFHYHMHVVPRFTDDNLRKLLSVRISAPEERAPYAQALKAHFQNNSL